YFATTFLSSSPTCPARQSGLCGLCPVCRNTRTEQARIAAVSPPPQGRIQKQDHHLQIVTSGLQRTAGLYSSCQQPMITSLVPRTGSPPHDCPRSRPAHTRRRRLGRRHVRYLCLPATGARHARAATTPAVDAGHLPEILSLGLDSNSAAARQRLLDGVHGLRWVCRCPSARPPDADDRLADDRALRLAVPR